MSAAIRFAAPFLLAASLAAAPALAQPETGEAVTAFPAAFFARSQPVSAYDMVQLLPGFQLQEGKTELRGYSGAGGNVLVDGARPASKEETLEALLKRIPAGDVDHVELIRSGASGFDMQGFALLANVVRKRSSRLGGRIEGEYAAFRHDYSAPRIAGGLNWQSGERVLDVQAAWYREIDDEHGFGRRDRFNPDGSPLRLGAYAQPEGTTYKELSASYSQGLAGGQFRASGLVKDSRMFADIEHIIAFPAPDHVLGTERRHGRATEAELRYDRSVAARSRIELIAIRRDRRDRAEEASFHGAGDEITRQDSDSSETILRSVLRRQSDLVSLELGAEGTLNILDSRNALAEDGVDVPLPAANVRVEEKRGELFANATWHPAAGLNVETGLRYEASRLSQSGDSRLAKSLAYWKPRLLVTWAPSPKDQLRLLLVREVGQLDFADFVSEASVTSGTITAGNRDLEPETLWRAELAWERAIGAGSITLTARQEWLSDVIDRIAVISPEGIFDSAGNIGSGRRRELQADANLPLDPLGLNGFTFKGSLLLRDSKVTDPLTGARRRISADAPVEASATLTHDLPALGLRWGLGYAHGQVETAYKIDEIERDSVSDRFDACVEYTPDKRWTIRVFGKKLTDSPVVRRRLIYTGLRGTSGVDFEEVRTLRSGRYFGVNVQRTFGG
jgi:outer membrane receptor protein involved in Fe transport